MQMRQKYLNLLIVLMFILRAPGDLPGCVAGSVSRSALSAPVSINKEAVRQIFSAANARKETRRHFTLQTTSEEQVDLAEIFGAQKMRRVMDFATGKGEWMRKAVDQPWMEKGAEVLGFDLEAPTVYNAKHAPINPRKDWQEITVLHAEDDPRFPETESLDLIHESLIEPRWLGVRTARLDKYDSLLKPKGWFLFAHVLDDKNINPAEFTEWLEGKGYRYRMFRADKHKFPRDYPESYWWSLFLNGFKLNQHFGINYLIAAQKNKPVSVLMPDFNFVIAERSI